MAGSPMNRPGQYLVDQWTDQRIPGPVSCRCPGGSLETPPRWHATIYIQNYLMGQDISAQNIMGQTPRLSPFQKGICVQCEFINDLHCE